MIRSGVYTLLLGCLIYLKIILSKFLNCYHDKILDSNFKIEKTWELEVAKFFGPMFR